MKTEAEAKQIIADLKKGHPNHAVVSAGDMIGATPLVSVSNLLADGFVAADRSREQKCPGQQAEVVTSITDVTPLPHNGCRPPKKRRV